MRLVFHQDKAVAEWVRRRIPYIEPGAFGNSFIAIGVADGDKPVAGVVYHSFFPKYGTMQVSIAADTARWAQRGIIRALLHIAFEQNGITKLWSVMASSNDRAIKFNKGIGFRQEAILSHHFGKDHAVVTRMFRKDYDRLYGVKGDGEERLRRKSAVV